MCEVFSLLTLGRASSGLVAASYLGLQYVKASLMIIYWVKEGKVECIEGRLVV